MKTKQAELLSAIENVEGCLETATKSLKNIRAMVGALTEEQPELPFKEDKPKKKKKKDKKPAKSKDKKPAKSKDKKGKKSTPEVTLAELTSLSRKLIRSKKKKEVIDILDGYGIKRVSDTPQKKIDDVFNSLNKLT